MAAELPIPWRHKIFILHGRVKTDVSSNFDQNLSLFHVGYYMDGPGRDRAWGLSVKYESDGFDKELKYGRSGYIYIQGRDFKGYRQSYLTG
jgi:hypothetical protein